MQCDCISREQCAGCSPAAHVDRQGVDNVIAVDDEHSLVVRDGRIDMGGYDPDAITDRGC